MATIRDVARLAGVSATTVSYALNAPERVSAAANDRVRRAVAALGYVPHAAARSLRNRTSRLLGLIVADITNPFFTALIEAIEEGASARGYSVLLCNANEDSGREEAHLRTLRSQRIDGLLIAPSGIASAARTGLLADLAVPIVLVDRTLEGLGYDAVLLDNRLAGYLATSHILDLGHRRIGLINGPERLRPAAERLQGYREALLSRNVRPDTALIQDGSFREQDAFTAATRLLTANNPPTAIFATNNLMTIGTMRALAAHGRRCPQDISVVGIDDFPWATAFTPRLTTVAQPVRSIAERALERLFLRIDGQDVMPETIRILPELRARDSCIQYGGTSEPNKETESQTFARVR